MKTTIIFAHPWHGSFNKAVLDTVVDRLQNQKKEHQIIDLNKDGFDPILREADLALYSKGQSNDPLVHQYQQMLNESDEVVFIFPVWWYGLPAILKGFIDKVMLKDYAFVETSTGLKGLLVHIKQAKIITTSEFPRWYLRFLAGNAIQRIFINSTLRGIGIRKAKWLNSDFTSSGSDQKRRKFLQKVSAAF